MLQHECNKNYYSKLILNFNFSKFIYFSYIENAHKINSFKFNSLILKEIKLCVLQYDYGACRLASYAARLHLVGQATSDGAAHVEP